MLASVCILHSYMVDLYAKKVFIVSLSNTAIAIPYYKVYSSDAGLKVRDWLHDAHEISESGCATSDLTHARLTMLCIHL